MHQLAAKWMLQVQTLRTRLPESLAELEPVPQERKSLARTLVLRQQVQELQELELEPLHHRLRR
jgi:hypothetical protein